MVGLLNGSDIYSNYYKIAHINCVNYVVYGAENKGNEQFLLELELIIRQKFPKCMITYYNKKIFHFNFDHVSQRYELENHFPELNILHTGQVSPQQLTSPQKLRENKDKEGSEYSSYLTLNFYKALKKTIIYNLSKADIILPFGNLSVRKVADDKWEVLQIDPFMLFNGDIFLMTSVKTRFQLFSSEIITRNLSKKPIQNFVIYLIPSGIRCHLQDPVNVASNFVSKIPLSSAEKCLYLLQLSTGLNKEKFKDRLWVKLVPNLQHMNNQTSDISMFIHNVDNKKIIYWPWDFCVLQLGYTSMHKHVEQEQQTEDPFNLLSEYIDISISMGQNNASANLLVPAVPNNHEQGIQSTLSTGLSNKSFLENPETEEANLQINPESTSLKIDSIGPNAESKSPGGMSQNNIEMETKLKEEDDAEMTDLFGDASGDEIGDDESPPKKEQSESAGSPNVIIDRPDMKDDYTVREKETKRGLDIKDNGINSTDSIFNQGGSSADQEVTQADFIEIPRDQMTISNLSDFKNQSPRMYDDPGAPLPIFPTPTIPQSGTFPLESKQTDPQMTTSQRPEDVSKSAFSPIQFNPIIESNIDTKYGKGGKFYVGKELSASEQNFMPFSQPITGYVSMNPKVNHSDVTEKSEFTSGLSALKSYQPFERESQQLNSFSNPLDSLIRNEATNKESPEMKLENLASSGLSLDGSFGLGDGTEFRDDMRSNSYDLEKGIGHGIRTTDYEKNLAEYNKDYHTDAPNDKTLQNYLQLDYNNSNDEADEENQEEYEDEEELEEESDEDEIIDSDSLKNSPPLRLNLNKSGAAAKLKNANDEKSSKNSAVFTGSYSSPLPLSNMQKYAFVKKFESPLHIPSVASDNLSPESVNDSVKQSNDIKLYRGDSMFDEFARPRTDATTESQIEHIPEAESTNYLPLLLRTINISSIPSMFLLNNIILNKPHIVSDFKMDEDELDDMKVLELDLVQDTAMKVKFKYLNELLSFLVPMLVYDIGMHDSKKIFETKVDESSTLSHDFNFYISEKRPDAEFETKLSTIFPYIYKVPINELIYTIDGDSDNKFMDSQNELRFLDDISVTERFDPSSHMRRLRSIIWDSIYPQEPCNKKEFERYMDTKDIPSQVVDAFDSDDPKLFSCATQKLRALKREKTILNFNSLAIRYWRFLDLIPEHGRKDFQTLLITQSDHNQSLMDDNDELLTEIFNNYKDCNFGTISRVSISLESSLEGEILENGIMTYDKADNVSLADNAYKQINHKLRKLVNLIKSDIINKTNNFDFERPLLLLFIDFDENFNSLLQLSKIARNFMFFLTYHGLPLVRTFSFAIPANDIFKMFGNRRRLKYLSQHKLSLLSMVLFNQCPNKFQPRETNLDESRDLFSRIVSEPPSKINFKIQSNGANFGSSDDLFLHFAYKRSADKKWFCGSWSDANGICTFSKAWYFTATVETEVDNKSKVANLQTIADEAWKISNRLFKTLHKEIVKRTPRSCGKKFLVLTRVDGIIPDEELIHWKRLSLKQKDVSLVVLTVNSFPSMLSSKVSLSTIGKENDVRTNNINMGRDFTSQNGFKSQSNHLSQNSNENTIPPATSASECILQSGTIYSGDVSGSINNGILLHSPQQFLNVPGNFLSPQDLPSNNTPTVDGNTDRSSIQNAVLVDTLDCTFASILSAPVPPSSSCTSSGMKAGYLLKEIKGEDNSSMYISYEVNLLSCSNNWNLNYLIKLLLQQYKSLITLNDVLLTRNIDISQDIQDEDNSLPYTDYMKFMSTSIIPCHVLAIIKTMDYLEHIEVDI